MHGVWGACVWQNIADHTALGSFTSEASLLAGTNDQPVIFKEWLLGKREGTGRVFRFKAAGILSCTGTPTYQFTVRLNTSAAVITGAILAASTTITCQSGITNQHWWLDTEFVLRTPAIGASNATMSLLRGMVGSPGGFAAPYHYGLSPDSMVTPATWTQTYNGGVDQYVSLSVACSASSASNAITCKGASLELLN